jgi:hypothetical protein
MVAYPRWLTTKLGLMMEAGPTACELMACGVGRPK